MMVHTRQSDQRDRQYDQNSTPHPPLRSLIGIAFTATALVLGMQGLGILQLLEWAVLDHWFRCRPVERNQASPVVIVTIDDKDIAHRGQWPLSDQQLAEFLTRLKAHDPAVMGLDLYRDLVIEPGHAELEQVFATTPNLIGIEKVVGQGSGPVIAPPPTLQALGQVAFNDLVLDSDGHIRRHILSIRDVEQTKFALGTQLALLYLEQNFQIGTEPLSNNRIRLGKAEFSPLQPNAGAYTNADVGGYQILANYLRLVEPMPTASMQQVWEGNLPPNVDLQDKIVLVGMKAESNWGDRFFTPFSNQSDETWAGVEIHANLAAQLVASALDGRSPLRTVPEPLEWGWIFLWAGVGVACNRVLAMNWRYLLRPVAGTGVLIVTTYLLFLGQYWLPLITPLLAFGGAWLITQGYLIWSTLRQENQRLESTVQIRTQELRQQNQALQQARTEADLANEAKSTFLAHISHELRTPLTAILGFGDLLQRSSHLSASEKDYAQTINRCSEHLLILINNVLDLSKIETGAVTLDPESLHLPKLLTEVQQMFQAQAIAKQLNLKLDLIGALPDWITVGSDKLRQILINLVGNAVKFTQTGYVILQARMITDTSQPADDSSNIGSFSHSEDDNSGLTAQLWLPGSTYRLECAVEDTGPGLTPEEIEHLFQPFVQTRAGKSLRKGSGLGLALVQQWVELMGGSISVSSTDGQGSRFSFQIPVQIPDSLPLGVVHSAEPIPAIAASQDYRVLIVDDEADNRRLLTQWLTEAHFAVQTANTGTAAITTFKCWQPQLILLDIHLPDLDGYEVARRIRGQWDRNTQDNSSSWLETDEPVILAVTAGVLRDRYADLLAAGCDDVLWKPLKVETLLTKIANYL